MKRREENLKERRENEEIQKGLGAHNFLSSSKKTVRKRHQKKKKREEERKFRF